MPGTQEKFVLHHLESRYNSGRSVEISAVNADFLGEKLHVEQTEAEVRLRLRNMQQRHWIPSWVGEFVIKGLGDGGWELQHTHVEAMDAHRQTLSHGGRPLNPQVYAGYRGCNWIHNGLLFGVMSDERALAVEALNQIKGVTAARWHTLKAFEPTDPFVHMSGNQEYAPRTPMICSFDSTLLKPVTPPDPSADPMFATTIWEPHDGLFIQDALQTVYIRG